MKRLISLFAILALTGCSSYVLSDGAVDGASMTVKGTVVSVDRDDDFVLEAGGRILFVDADNIDDEVELGDRVIVVGVVDNDADDNEAPELDAESIKPWTK